MCGMFFSASRDPQDYDEANPVTAPINHNPPDSENLQPAPVLQMSSQHPSKAAEQPKKQAVPSMSHSEKAQPGQHEHTQQPSVPAPAVTDDQKSPFQGFDAAKANNPYLQRLNHLYPDGAYTKTPLFSSTGEIIGQVTKPAAAIGSGGNGLSAGLDKPANGTGATGPDVGTGTSAAPGGPTWCNIKDLSSTPWNSGTDNAVAGRPGLFKFTGRPTTAANPVDIIPGGPNIAAPAAAGSRAFDFIPPANDTTALGGVAPKFAAPSGRLHLIDLSEGNEDGPAPGEAMGRAGLYDRFGGDKDAPGSLVDALMRTLETMIQDKGQTSSNGAPLENALLNSPLKGTSSDPSKTITDTPAQEKLPSSEVLLSYLKKLLDQSYHADILGRLATDLSGPDTGMRNSAAEVVRECLKVEEIRLEINEKVEMLEKLRAGQAILTDKNGDILDWTAGLYNLQNTQEDLRRRKQEADKLIQEWKAEDAKLAPLRRRNEELECKVDEMKKSTVPAEKVEKMEITIGGQAKAISHLKDTLKAKEFSLEAAQKDLEIKRSQLKLMENLKVEHAQAKERGRVLADKVADLSRSIKDKDELLALARDEAQKAGVDLFEKGKEIKRLQHELAQAKNEISTLEPLREEVFIRKQERDKARYELEWAQREMEKLKVEIKDQHLNAKAEKETRAALNKRLASAWQERTTLIEGLKSRDKDVQELQIEVANARIQVAEAQAKVAENAAPAQPGADAPRDGVYKLPKVVDWRTLKAENDRIEAENKALEAGIAAMAVQLSEEEREVRAKEKRLKELREENRAWEKRHKEELAKEREKERQEAEKSK